MKKSKKIARCLNGARLFGDNGAVFVGLRGLFLDETLKLPG